jgi:hypothetical protein
MNSQGTYNIQVKDITDPLYAEAIEDYWTWLLGNQQVLNDNVRTVSNNKIFYTHACYGYEFIYGVNGETSRKNLCGSAPQSNHVERFSNEDKSDFEFVFIPVLDTMITKQGKGPSGQRLSIEEMNAILAFENDAVTETDIAVTIKKKEQGGSWGPPLPIVSNLLYYRVSSPADPDSTFPLYVPPDSALASKMEFPITADSTLDTRAEGRYLLVEKPSEDGIYRIFADGKGQRGFRSMIQIDLEI